MASAVVLGSGGREHAIALKLLESPDVSEVTVIPGNPGMAIGGKLKVASLSTLESVSAYLDELKPSLVVVGPETYIDAGWSDHLRSRGHAVFGPSKAAGMLESSKIYSKDFMNRHDIPTAASFSVRTYDEALGVLDNWKSEFPPVVKCDALAGGKGVVVAESLDEAREAIFNFMKNESFGVHSEGLVLEERLIGKEMSLFVLCDGQKYQVFSYACDYKRLLDEHQGPNTGGMGCVTPENFPSAEAWDYINNEIVIKSIDGLARDGLPFQGVLFIGLMVGQSQAHVIEYNVRFGDPETQLMMAALDADLYEILLACARGELKESSLVPLPTRGAGVHIVMVSNGYPDLEKKGMELGNPIQVDSTPQGILTYAGVKQAEDGKLVNSSGRVLGLTVIASSAQEARSIAYQEIQKINFKGAHFRSDIGL